MSNKILFFIDHYYPSKFSGGPAVSIDTIIKKIDFKNKSIKIYTSNYEIDGVKLFDKHKKNLYDYIEYFNTNSLIGLIYYIYKVFNNLDANWYLNSFFSIKYSIIPILISKLFGKKVIIAPRGELTEGALTIKPKKKRFYIYLFKKFLQNKIVWHLTSSLEYNEIKKIEFRDLKIQLIENFYKRVTMPQIKKNDEFTIVFYSRITPKKNLRYIYEILKEIKNKKILFYVIGNVEEQSYFDRCLADEKSLPSNIKVKYFLKNDFETNLKLINQSHLFFLPTFSENFGHVINEALCLGIYILISNNTPWDSYLKRNNFGASFSLKNKNLFINYINNLYKSKIWNSNQTFINNAVKHHNFIQYRNNKLKKKYQSLFNLI